MKIKRILLGLILVILLICLIPINLQSTKTLSNPDLGTSQANEIIDYDFRTSILDTSNKDIINLRHNDIITNEYSGVYSFVNDSGTPNGWDNLSVGNGRIEVFDTVDKHDSVLSLITIDVDSAQIEQEFDDGNQYDEMVELWYRTNDATRTSYIRLFEQDTASVVFQITGDLFKIHNGISYQTLDTIPHNNVWYHIEIDFVCATDRTYIYINDYYEGGFDFSNAADAIDTLAFLNEGFAGGYSISFDAVGYTWEGNYTLHGNKTPIIQEVDSDILTSDMYQFNFNSTGNPYIRYETDIYGWTIVEPTYSSLDKPSLHYRYYNPSVKNETIKEKNAIWIKSHTSGAGVKNDSLNIYGDKINISFGINFYLSISYLQHSFNVSIKSRNNNEIVKLGFDPVFVSAYHTNDLLDMYYYDGAVWQFLERFHRVKNYNFYQFELYLDDFDVSLKWYKDGIYNNTYTFPFIIERNGVNSISFLNHDAYQDAYFQFMRLCYIGVYQYNISQSFEYGCIRYNFDRIWNFDYYNFFNFTSNDLTKMITYIYQDSYESFNIRSHFNQSIFYNVCKVEIKPYTNLWIITNNISMDNSKLSIEGISMDEYVNSVVFRSYTPRYASFNTNENNSYFYADNNQLKYKLHLTLNYTFENIVIYFDIYHRGVDNATLILGGRETLTCFGQTWFMIEYLGFQDPTRIDLADYYSMYYKPLPFARVMNVFVFTANDFMTNNTFTGFVYHGFFSDLKIIYGDFLLPGYSEWTITILSLIAIIIPLIVILVPTLSIHAVYKKKEAIIPMLILFTIIAFATQLIPFQVFFVIIFALGCGILLQYKKERSG